MHPFDTALTIQSEAVVRGTVDDILREQMPGSETKTREELEAIVRDVHEDAMRRFAVGELKPKTALEGARWEYSEIVKRLRNS
jgi:hypothetical protein